MINDVNMIEYSIHTKNLEKININARGIINVSFPSINRWAAAKHEPIIKVKRKIVELCKENNIDL